MSGIDIDKARALDLGITFVGDEWKCLQEDDITVSILSGGFSGRLYIVEDVSNSSNKNPNKKFLVRLYGGKLIDKDDVCKAGKCETSEGIVFFANAMKGLGPKLLGVFDGGRVEEFVPSHRINEVDLSDENTERELIRKLARFHALQVPVSKKKRDLLYISATYQDEYIRENILKIINRLDLSCDCIEYLDEDYEDEHSFLRSFEAKVGGRLVFCHGDLNRNNILYRDTPDQFNERVMLIDYELAATDYRGTDLSLWLMNRMFSLNEDGSFQQVTDWPDINHRRMLVTEYLNETRKLNYFEFDENGIDTVDHVLMEIDFFTMYGMQLVKGFFKRMANNEFFHQQSDVLLRSWISFIPSSGKIYAQHKKYFIENYSKARALDLGITFVGDEWKCLQEDDITVNILSGGFSGRLYIVEDVSSTSNKNPNKKFLVRLYGGKLIDKDDVCKAGKCETSEGIVFFANAMKGLGPKLLGVFDGGRVEEFVPSHRINEVDLSDENTERELIRKLARFHALQVPVSKKKRDLLYISATYQDEYVRENILKITDRLDLSYDYIEYLDEDYEDEHSFLRSFEAKVGGRLVLCHGDLNRNNILYRDTPDQFNERVMLIDYELAATDYRGTDLGLWMMNRMFSMNEDGSFEQVTDWPDINHRRMLVTEYLNETRKLNYFEFDENGIDSIDHVLMEIDFFVMYCMQLIKGFFKRMPNNEFFHQQSDVLLRSWISFIPSSGKIYAQHKKYFIENYSKVL
ncbi:Choline kinase alpha [Pseudolycoriella hygida]|uniref:Choline kinase alpha n=1 Tax=Pseudolycoriella hygida TaxID=35572 RepID=A0A9Q0S7D2_9DIPT|nr:Choline kinase alpha [Pseudolycoriella hygida]